MSYPGTAAQSLHLLDLCFHKALGDSENFLEECGGGPPPGTLGRRLGLQTWGRCSPTSPSPCPQPSTSSVTSDEKVDYVQVDKEKTQALQNTMQEWTDVRQSSEPSKGAKL